MTAPPALSTNHNFSSFLFRLFKAIASMACDLAPRLGTLKASVFLHNSILSAMMRAPLRFFDITPVGRILSRFSADQEATDNGIPDIISDGIWCFFEVTNWHFTRGHCLHALELFLTNIGSRALSLLLLSTEVCIAVGAWMLVQLSEFLEWIPRQRELQAK